MEPFDVPQQRVCVREQRMGQQDRLGRLKVGFSGHDNPRMIGRLSAEGRNQVGHLDRNVPDSVPHPHAEEGCHLVVSGTTGPQPTTHLGAHNLNEAAFQGTVHVFVGGQGDEIAAGYFFAKTIKAVKHGVQVGVGKQAGLV